LVLVWWWGPADRKVGRAHSFLATIPFLIPYQWATLEDMAQPIDPIRVRIDQIERMLMFDYEPGSSEALFDICDQQGRIVMTGEVSSPETRVRITDLDGEEYYLMVLDGELSTVKPFQLRRAV
jgi:hypothetical protein